MIPQKYKLLQQEILDATITKKTIKQLFNYELRI